jgi:phospholipase/lecithinase/hemolysin
LKFPNWNFTLERKIKQFVAEKETTNSPVTAIYYSSYKVFTDILDDPESYGLGKDQSKTGGTIWVDHLHPTSAVHAIVATELDSMLTGILPSSSVGTQE